MILQFMKQSALEIWLPSRESLSRRKSFRISSICSSPEQLSRLRLFRLYRFPRKAQSIMPQAEISRLSRAVQVVKKEKSFTGMAEIASFFSLDIFPIMLKSPLTISSLSGRASFKGSISFWKTGLPPQDRFLIFWKS